MSSVAIALWGKDISVTARVGKWVEEIFVREDVSRITSGKKQTLTRAKYKQQKRFLNDTISNLHMKFLAENLALS